ncbi:hypothetical protein ACFQYP_00310 [Nonomuraea antimicrobica]
MTASTEHASVGVVGRHWGTASTIRQIDLTGIARDNILDRNTTASSFTTIPLGEAVADIEALRQAFVADMNTLAERGQEGGNASRYVADIEMEAQIWLGGYEKPMFAVANDYLAWCYLEVVPPVEADAGTVAVFDPVPGAP